MNVDGKLHKMIDLFLYTKDFKYLLSAASKSESIKIVQLNIKWI